MNHEKYNKRIDILKCYQLILPRFKKSPNHSKFNQRWIIEIKYPQSFQPFIDFFLITNLWRSFETLGHGISKVYGT
jgi:hypothetical protein